jgi:hypothetical protein
VTDIFVFDRFSKSIHCLSVASPFPFNQGNLPSVYPSISADGQWVAFTSFATNLVPNDTNGNTDIFVVTRGGGLIERVSVGRQGDQEIQADGDSSHPSISGDGRFVAFESNATNLAPEGDTNGERDIFVFDRQTRTIQRVSVDSAGNQADRESYHPSISFDGRIVAFESFATNLVPDDTNAARDIFVHEKLHEKSYVHSVTLTSGQVAEGLDFGNFQPGEIHGRKWNDLDADGRRDDEEAPLPNWQIYLDLNTSGQYDAGEPLTMTDEQGNYAFRHLPAGAYTVAEVLPAGWRQTFPADSAPHVVDLERSEVATEIDFGNFYYFSRIEGLKYHDLDQDGTRDPGEPGLEGWNIYVDLNDNGLHEAVEAFGTTDGDGGFALARDIPQGTFETVVGTQFADRITGSSAADRIWGRGGDDWIYGGLGDDFLYGEAGNDYLFGEGGNNSLLGGEGNDQLTAGSGRNVLIGGLGADTLKGARGDDLLIGGTTDYDANDTALRAILAEWASRRSFAVRIDNLRNGGGSNGGFVLRKRETVHDDDARDALFGGPGSDWFLDFDSDFVADRGPRDR